MSPRRNDYWEKRFPKRREVHGGIETRSRKGTFGKSWWSRALVELVEEFGDPGRMSRGRSYARAGQVISLQIEPGGVFGEVQGSQPFPFSCVLSMRELDEEQLAELVAQVQAAPGRLAEIASGALPQDLRSLLLPERVSELGFDCTCPDAGYPCKHVAALIYLTAEHLDDHAHEMLTLRGIDLESLIDGVESTTTEADSQDPFGEHTVLPALPDPAPGPVLDDLDPVALRAALRAVTPDEPTVATGLRELAELYRQLVG